MTTIYCDQQNCELNKSETCLEKHITLCRIRDVTQHFWFACFMYKAKDTSEPAIQHGQAKACACIKWEDGLIDSGKCDVHGRRPPEC